MLKKLKSFKKYTIGIIGGAGPMAGAILLKNIIKTCQKHYFCHKDEDFPKIILVSVPFCQMLKPNTFEQKEDNVRNQLNENIEFLIKNNVDKILIACNTLHYFLNDIYKNKIVNLTSTTIEFINNNFCSASNKILLLSTSLTANSKLYECKNIIKPNIKDQKTIDDIISKIMSGNHSEIEVKKIIEIFNFYRNKYPSINSLLLGCTEFSVLNYEFNLDQKINDFFLKKKSKIKLIDPMFIIAEKLLKLL